MGNCEMAVWLTPATGHSDLTTVAESMNDEPALLPRYSLLSESLELW